MGFLVLHLVFTSVALAALVKSDSDALFHLDDFLFVKQAISPCSDCDWTSVQDIGVHGRALFPSFPERDSYYDRLPLAAKSQVRPAVWTLSTMSAGMYCEFATSSPVIYLNVSYTSPELSMYHFSATGVSGLDLYAWDDNSSTWRFTSVTTTIVYPVSVSEMQSAARADGTPTLYRLHLPTYNGVASLFIGHLPGHPVQAMNRTVSKPVVWYGTSILQGAVASRPGMIFTSQISRALGLEIFNFGFSGNVSYDCSAGASGHRFPKRNILSQGMMELNVSKFIGDIDAATFIIDCAPNMTPDLISQNTEPLVLFLRATRASAPIVLVGPPQYGADWIDPSLNDAKRSALQAAFSKLIADGVTNLHMILNTKDELYASSPLISPTVEGTHPTDLGHFDTSQFYIRFLSALL